MTDERTEREPCPDCGEGMEVQHVCENCGKREAI